MAKCCHTRISQSVCSVQNNDTHQWNLKQTATNCVYKGFSEIHSDEYHYNIYIYIYMCVCVCVCVCVCIMLASMCMMLVYV